MLTLVSDLLLTDTFLIKGTVEDKYTRLSQVLDEHRKFFLTERFLDGVTPPSAAYSPLDETVTLTVDVTPRLLLSPSLRTQVIVRALVVGFSEVLL